MIQTNKLTEKLIIKHITTSASTYGEVVNIYKPICTVFASITSQRGNMAFNENNGNIYNDNISFYMRFKNLDKKKTVIEYNCEDYQINNITNIGRTATIIDCELSK